MELAINSYSIRNEWEDLGPDPFGALIAICKDRGVTNVELLDRHFEGYDLREVVKRFTNEGIKVFAIGPHVHLLEKPDAVEKAIREGTEWLELAGTCGVESVRFQVGNGPLPRAWPPLDDFDEEDWEDYNEQMDEAVRLSMEIIGPLVEVAERVGVNIGIETHHSYSSNYVYMQRLEEKVKSPRLGWIFDIGNYETDEMRWKALDVIKSNVKYIHAKAYKFDDAGMEVSLDYPRAARVLAGAGFAGKWSVEFEGKMNGILGVFKTLELIKYSIAQARGESYEIRTDFPSGDELLERFRTS